eukprot:TRINITY_DN23771_c0_g1_i1.p1 TRINITY_DN23771_c0_g1~~TRINITY_DN23771_c0_g1_i1.p1  ORF type:complete len:793 (+),score=134.89 TRINITY_DN23771_c0_g1_i1:407-2785(+)
MCAACARPHVYEGDDEGCKANLTDCAAVPPGGSCTVACRWPYIMVGRPTAMGCKAGNEFTGRALELLGGWPKCVCPEPTKVPIGYKFGYKGRIECAEGYVGVPQLHEQRCDCPEVAVMTGCTAVADLKPCAKPYRIDKCRYDVSGCDGGVEPGKSCTVRCQQPTFSQDEALASCPYNNTNASTEPEWSSLRCILQYCEDPSPLPEGYEYNAEGGLQCIEGYSGTPTKQCSLGVTWQSTCEADTVFSGCTKIVNCQPPMILDTGDPPGIDKCMLNVYDCIDVEPGKTCEISCKWPYVGDPVIATCPMGNTDPAGLDWERPGCTLDPAGCAGEPNNVTEEYQPVPPSGLFPFGYKCARGYVGSPVKVCMPRVTCVPELQLRGCELILPCSEPKTNASKCMYQMADCQSVSPGTYCSLSCKAPFVGSATQGYCPNGNTNVNGLLWTPPVCTRGDYCMPPEYMPAGYKKLYPHGVECAVGYSGTANVTCEWSEEQCDNVPKLSGCVEEVPCASYNASGVRACLFEPSDGCASVAAGESCDVKCKHPFEGDEGKLYCPAGNIDPKTELHGAGPQCGCDEPNPAPEGYVMKTTYEFKAGGGYITKNHWECAPGYLGQAVKTCTTSDTNCSPKPALHGCFAPIPCSVGTWLDEDVRPGFIGGVLSFGAAMVDLRIDESNITGYKIMWSDGCNASEPIRAPVLKQATSRGSCCDPTAYTVRLPMMPVPAVSMQDGKVRIAVVAITTSGAAPPVGLTLALEDVSGSQLATAAADGRHHRRAVFWVLLTVFGLGCLYSEFIV